jgi:hypothetical protein
VFCAENGVLQQIVRFHLSNIPKLYADMPDAVQFVRAHAQEIEQYALNKRFSVMVASTYPTLPSPVPATDEWMKAHQRAAAAFTESFPKFAAERGEYWLESIWFDFLTMHETVEEQLDSMFEFELASWAAQVALLSLQVALQGDPGRYRELRARDDEFRSVAQAKLGF